MAAVVGYIAQAWNSSGSATLSLTSLTAPGGGTVSAAAGQMALVETEHSSSRTEVPDGWTSVPTGALWWRILTAADIAAGSVTVNARLTSLTVLSGAAGIGRVTEQATVKVRASNGGAFYRGWTSRWRTNLGAGSTYRLGAETSSPDDNHRHAVYWRAAAAAGYLSLPSASDDATWRAIEILAPAAPLAPRILSPESGAAVHRDKIVQVAIAHQSAAGLPPTTVKLVIRVSGGTWGSVKADGTIAAGDTSQTIAVTGAADGTITVTIAAAALTANAQYELVAYSADVAGWSPASATSTLVARVVPTATVSLTTAAGDLSPTVTATITPGSGTTAAWRIRLCPAADGTPDAPLWDSGQVASTSASVSVEIPAADLAPLVTNGGSYKAWLLPTDTSLTGVWAASTAQSISWTPPSAPGSIVAVDGTPPSITVSGVPVGSTRVEVWGASTEAEDWLLIESVESPGSAVVTSDPRAPYGEPRRYRTRAWALVDGVALPSAWVTSSAITSTDMCAYVISVGGSSWVQVKIVDAGALMPIQGVSRSTGLGDVAQRVDRTMVAGYESWWLAETDTADDEATLRGWLTDPDRPQLWLKPTPERSFLVGPTHVPALLTAVAPGLTVERFDATNTSARYIRWPWITQEEDA